MRRITEDSAQSIISKYATLIFDCDGVLWRGRQIIAGAPPAISHLRGLHKTLLFLTNNSTHSRIHLQQKFADFGFKVQTDELLGSAFLLAHLLRQRIDPSENSWVYVVGRQGIVDELQNVKIQAFGLEDDGHVFDFETFAGPSDWSSRQVTAVVVGFDHHFNYTKTAKAMHYLRNPQCLFLATNMDATFPDTHGPLPGTGSVVRSIEEACGRAAHVVGKPNPLVLEAIRSLKPSIDPKTTLMVGDRMDTDVAFGKACGIDTLLVESGVSLESEVVDLPLSLQPEYIASSIAILGPAISTRIH